jgi:hypothetical protein
MKEINVLKGIPDHRAPPANKAKQVPKESKVKPVPLAYKESKAKQVPLAYKEHKEKQEPKES